MSAPEEPSIDVASRGLIFILDGAVCLEIKDFGRLEFPPEQAESVARSLLQAAKIVREQNPKGLVKL